MKPLVSVLVAVAVLLAAARLRAPARPDATPVRELLSRPAGYDGRVVVVRTAGFQPAGPGRMHYRRFADQPPALVAVYAGPPPASVPLAVCGVFRAGDPCVIEDCTPALPRP